jgi:RNA polymerase sigma-70 factor, ECF subfamily
MKLDDKGLVERAKLGDDKRVLDIAVHYVGNGDDAKDVYQEVFLRVYRNLRSFKLRSAFSTWLYRIVVNVCLTHKKKMSRYGHTSLNMVHRPDGDVGEREDVLVDESTSDRQALDSDMAVHVKEAMRRLSPQQRMVFVLRHHQGYKMREIAVMMKCAEGTVKKHLFTATRRLRDQLRDIYEPQ